jgi:hypothetical protein
MKHPPNEREERKKRKELAVRMSFAVDVGEMPILLIRISIYSV